MPSAAANETASRIRSSIVSRETPSAASFPSEIGLSITDAVKAELDERLHVCAHGAREAPDLRIEAGFENERDRARVVLGDAREPGLDAIDAGSRERACNLHFLLWR